MPHAGQQRQGSRTLALSHRIPVAFEILPTDW
jgi:hypothetical protein